MRQKRQQHEMVVTWTSANTFDSYLSCKPKLCLKDVLWALFICRQMRQVELSLEERKHSGPCSQICEHGGWSVVVWVLLCCFRTWTACIQWGGNEFQTVLWNFEGECQSSGGLRFDTTRQRPKPRKWIVENCVLEWGRVRNVLAWPEEFWLNPQRHW